MTINENIKHLKNLENYTETKHPSQPVYFDHHDVLRFKKNKIVEYLLDNGAIDLNMIASLDFSIDDRRQFAQLIGYSVSGYSELSYSNQDEVDAIYMSVEIGIDVKDAKIKVLEDKLHRVKLGMRDAVADLFEIHPDDLRVKF